MPRPIIFATQRAVLLGGLLWGAVSCLATSGFASDVVTVTLTDGRVVTGVVDHATDSNHLWLRRDEPGVELSSQFAWGQIAEGQIDGQVVGRIELQQASQLLKRPGRKFLELVPTPARETTDPPRPNSMAVDTKVRALHIDAFLAQWDGDVQPDGVRIFVAPVDSRGNVVPIHGQIDFTLVAEMEKLNGGQSGSLRPEFHELEHGTFLVRREHFASGIAIYELPFSTRHPDFDFNIATQALVHARLGISGQGVFEASDSHVWLREFSRIRDQLQYYTPGRYLPLESGGQWNR